VVVLRWLQAAARCRLVLAAVGATLLVVLLITGRQLSDKPLTDAAVAAPTIAVENEWGEQLTLPTSVELSACTKNRGRARRLAALMADDEYYLARARGFSAPNDSLQEARERRISELERRLKRLRKRLSSAERICRRSLQNWVVEELQRRSRSISCDPSYDPLCCK